MPAKLDHSRKHPVVNPGHKPALPQEPIQRHSRVDTLPLWLPASGSGEPTPEDFSSCKTRLSNPRRGPRARGYRRPASHQWLANRRFSLVHLAQSSSLRPSLTLSHYLPQYFPSGSRTNHHHFHLPMSPQTHLLLYQSMRQ